MKHTRQTVCGNVSLQVRPTDRIFSPVTVQETDDLSPSRWMQHRLKYIFWITKRNPVPISTSFGQKP